MFHLAVLLAVGGGGMSRYCCDSKVLVCVLVTLCDSAIYLSMSSSDLSLELSVLGTVQFSRSHATAFGCRTTAQLTEE